MPADATPARAPSPDPRHHHDPLAARSVFVAPARADRPHDAEDRAGSDAPPRAACPFCAGNETLTPPAVLSEPGDETQPWLARIVPNMYPCAVHAPQAARGARAAQEPERPAHGLHEVVIESAAHARSILAVDPAAWRAVWELCRRRLEMLASREDLAWATVFKNSGPRAGASLEHLHSQLVALDFVPPVMQTELAAAALLNDPFGAMLAEAEATGRIVAGIGDLVLVVPHAPRQPFEAWILPREPEPFFHATSRSRVDALADLTRHYVERLERLAPAADFNWWLHPLPFGSHAPAALADTWHWHLEILPRLAHLAGFELATGCHSTTMPPADAADLLRGA
jgi:UDPglucose--hexose-1-phosphate uridylyltransferase